MLRYWLSFWRHFFFSGGAAFVLKERLKRRRVGARIKEDERGVVPESPAALLAGANRDLQAERLPRIDMDTYAVARALASEHGNEPVSVRRWVAWAIRNSAKRRKLSPFRRLTDSRSSASGMFARQRTDGRFAATNLAPTFEDVQIAREVLNAPSSEDPTDGATNFFSPRTQDILFRKAQQGDPRFVGRITVDADGLRERWARRGLQSVGTPPGVPADKVEFFRRANA